MPNTIAVTLTPGTVNGQFAWNMSVDGKAQAPGTAPPIKADHGTSPDFSFTLQNAPNITFSSFLVPAGTTEIHNVSQVSGATTFTFKDHNKDAGDVPYVILFNGAPKLDPIISNGGGGNGFYESDTIVEYAGYAIAAAVILFFVVRRMMRKEKY
jgi:hypothetical protein